MQKENKMKRKIIFKSASYLKKSVGAELVDAAFGMTHTSTRMGTLSLGGSSSSLPRESWMASLPDDTWLSRLTLPGTHQSGAQGPGGLLTQCQNWSIADQLKYGIRFLDLRVRRVGKDLTIHHGVVSQNMTLTDVLRDCIPFLQQDPGECIIMSIKSEEGDGTLFLGPKPLDPVYKTVGETFIQTYSNWYYTGYDGQNVPLWYLESPTPKLGAVRGKIVLFSRYTASPLVGLGLRHWQDNTSFSSLSRLHNGEMYYVEDRYHIPTLFDIPKKKEAIWQNLNQARQDASSAWYLTFTSGASLLAFPRDVAKRVNRWLRDRCLPGLAGMKPLHRLGVVLMDFPSTENIDWLITRAGLPDRESSSSDGV